MTIPPSTTATVPLKFQVLSEEPLTQDLLVCIDLYSSGDLVFKNQCVPYTNNNLNLQFVPAGPASVSLSLKKGGLILPDSTTSLPFRIVTMESALPLLIGPPNLQFLANPNTDSSDASIEFFLSDIALTSYLVVCLEVTPISDTSFRVKRTCVPPDQNHLSLYNLPAGSYQLSLEFQQANTPFTQFPSSRKVSSIVISRLEDLLPSIFVDNPILEYGISPESEHVSEVLLNVASTAHPKYPNTDMISHTDICLSLIPGANSTLEEMSNCVPNKVFLQFTLRQIPRGTHSYSLTLRSHHNPSIIFEKSKLSGRIVVQDMEEFIPSYDWTALKPWHTIPSGLETRLPVGSGSRKEARIPQPWRLQTSMPPPCKYFLRMDISRSTTIDEIRTAAATKCRMPVSCFEVLVGKEVVVDYEATSEGVELFSRSVELRFLESNEECEVSSH